MSGSAGGCSTSIASSVKRLLMPSVYITRVPSGGKSNVGALEARENVANDAASRAQSLLVNPTPYACLYVTDANVR